MFFIIEDCDCFGPVEAVKQKWEAIEHLDKEVFFHSELIYRRELSGEKSIED